MPNLQQVFAKEKELNAAFRKLEIGRISSEGFRDELRRLGLHETSTLRKVLDEHDLQGGATYKKVLKALYLPDYMYALYTSAHLLLFQRFANNTQLYYYD